MLKLLTKNLIRLMVAMPLVALVACSSTRKADGPPPGSNDILDLLTGFGESISKRDFVKAVGYMVPAERSQMLDANGRVPEDKQRQLMALRLQRLIRTPSVRVEGGYLAGIYDLLAAERQGNSGEMMASGSEGTEMAAGAGEAEGVESTASEDEEATPAIVELDPQDDPALKAAVNKFFLAVNQKNWNAALALVNDNEKKIFFDERGRLKESSKARLGKIDTEGKNALTLTDGKLTGITLLLPSD